MCCRLLVDDMAHSFLHQRCNRQLRRSKRSCRARYAALPRVPHLSYFYLYDRGIKFLSTPIEGWFNSLLRCIYVASHISKLHFLGVALLNPFTKCSLRYKFYVGLFIHVSPQFTYEMKWKYFPSFKNPCYVLFKAYSSLGLVLFPTISSYLLRLNNILLKFIEMLDAHRLFITRSSLVLLIRVLCRLQVCNLTIEAEKIISPFINV